MCELVLRGRRSGRVNQRREQELETEGVHMGLCSLALYSKYFGYLIICLVHQLRPFLQVSPGDTICSYDFHVTRSYSI